MKIMLKIDKIDAEIILKWYVCYRDDVPALPSDIKLADKLIRYICPGEEEEKDGGETADKLG